MYLSDNNYATYAGVSILSLLENNQMIDEICVYVIDDNIADDNKKKYNEIISKYGREIVYLDMRFAIETLKRLGAPSYRNSYTTYLKIFAFAALKKYDVERVFFVDSDSIVLGDLSEMIDYDMNGKTICAVQDILCRDYMVSLGFEKSDAWYNM